MNRHAYLIIAHNEPEIFRLLLKSIDDYRNDIFVHIDKKSDFELMTKNVILEKSHLYYIDSIDCRWGDYSQILCEMKLFKFAREHGSYSYYHLLSGVDLPIKNQDYIHSFFIKNSPQVFVSIWKDTSYKEIWEKILCYNYFTRTLKHKNIFIRLLSKRLRKFFVLVQRYLKFRRKNDLNLYKGDNWCSLPEDCVEYLLKNENIIIHNFQRTCCADEIFIQSILMSSNFRDRISEIGCLRLVNWTKKGDSPDIWQDTDFNKLKNSQCLFARKFSGKKIDLAMKVINELADIK